MYNVVPIKVSFRTTLFLVVKTMQWPSISYVYIDYFLFNYYNNGLSIICDTSKFSTLGGCASLHMSVLKLAENKSSYLKLLLTYVFHIIIQAKALVFSFSFYQSSKGLFC